MTHLLKHMRMNVTKHLQEEIIIIIMLLKLWRHVANQMNNARILTPEEMLA